LASGESPPWGRGDCTNLPLHRYSICIISIIRVVTLVKVSYTDITYSVPTALIWSMLEPTLGITLACIPVTRPLFMRGINSTRGRGSGHYYYKPSSDYDSRNFQNLDEQQQLYPMKNVKSEVIARYSSNGDDSLRSAWNRSTDEVGAQAMMMPDAEPILGGINVKREFNIRSSHGHAT